MLPGQKYASQTDYRAYIADAQDDIERTQSALESEAAARSCDLATLLQSDSGGGGGGGGGGGSSAEFCEGAFLSAIFDNLESCFRKSIEVNALITSIIMRLVRMPHAASTLVILFSFF